MTANVIFHPADQKRLIRTENGRIVISGAFLEPVGEHAAATNFEERAGGAYRRSWPLSPMVVMEHRACCDRLQLVLVDAPCFLKSVAQRRAFERVIFFDRAVRIDDQDTKVGKADAFLDANAAERQLQHIVEHTDAEWVRIGHIAVEYPAHPRPEFRRRHRGLSERQRAVVAVAVKEIGTWNAERLEIIVYCIGRRAGINDGQDAREEPFAIRVVLQRPNTRLDRCVASFTDPIQAKAIVNLGRSVDAYGQADLVLDTDVEDRLRDEDPVGLNADAARETNLRAETRQKRT